MAETDRVGSQFGPYRIDDVLGRGGMGVVYRAFDTERDRVVALKLLNADLANDPTYQERFRRESRAAARLGEPHVVPIHDWGEIDGVLFIDMRFVDGENLRAVLRRDGSLAPTRAVAIIEQVAAALEAAHHDGLVHRDIKPENILLGANDFAYLVDFGIAHAETDTQLTQVGTAIGSVAYMAPELFDSDTVSPATDIYALTCVLFECLTGRVPHPATTISAAVKAAVLNDAPNPSAINGEVPQAFDVVIRRGLATEPAQRYPSTTALAEAARLALRDEVADADATTVIARPDVPTTMLAPPTIVPGAADPPAEYAAPQYFSPTRQPAPQYYAPYPTIPPEPPRRGGRGALPVVLGAAIAVVLLALVGLGAYWLLSGSSGGDSTAGPTTPTVTQTITPGDAAPQSTPTATTQAGPPPGATECAPGVAIGTSITSCPFAQAVRDEYLRTGPTGQARTIVAYSPVTGSSYSMACTPEGSVVACRGGNDALVYVY
ncbi:serine/threonine-protein kinase [Gordonia sp. CPCC 205515]|uniref:serine/threonine-protein kinase n=1 Tax=Gordonia sp. CPCC 205515 TaxID=3140791 RepID=UPI003AF406DB